MGIGKGPPTNVGPRASQLNPALELPKGSTEHSWTRRTGKRIEDF